MSIKQLIKSAVDKITDNFNIKNIILFESVPAYSDNTKAVFDEMIKREITDDAELEKLEEAIAFKNVSNMPARVKCALLAWHTLEDMIEKGETDGKISSSCCH